MSAELMQQHQTRLYVCQRGQALMNRWSHADYESAALTELDSLCSDSMRLCALKNWTLLSLFVYLIESAWDNCDHRTFKVTFLDIFNSCASSWSFYLWSLLFFSAVWWCVKWCLSPAPLSVVCNYEFYFTLKHFVKRHCASKKKKKHRQTK